MGPQPSSSVRGLVNREPLSTLRQERGHETPVGTWHFWGFDASSREAEGLTHGTEDAQR